MPGITRRSACPALAGIPVTQRGVATSVHVTSGHVGADAAALAALAAGATVVFLMGVSALAGICAAARAAGRGCRPAGRDRRAGVDRRASGSPARPSATAAEVAEREGVRAPAIIVMGRVAAEGFLDDPVCATTGGRMTDPVRTDAGRSQGRRSRAASSR